MISPRLRQHMLSMFVHDHVVGKAKKRSVFWTHKVTTNETQIRPGDLRTLERKGFLRFELSGMSSLFGLRFWDCEITDAGKEELADEFAARCAAADEENERKENPEPFGESEET